MTSGKSGVDMSTPVHPVATPLLTTGDQLYELCGVLYTVTGFLLLFIYAMINMNIVSWGTREVAHADDVDVDAANRVKQPNAWTSFIHEVIVVCISIQ